MAKFPALSKLRPSRPLILSLSIAFCLALAACGDPTINRPVTGVQVIVPGARDVQPEVDPQATAPVRPAPVPGSGPEGAVDLPPGPITVGLLLPLSGPSARLGEALFQAAQLALFDIGSEELVLLPVDTGGTAEGAARAAREAIDNGATLILGPLFSASVKAVAPVALDAGLGVIAFSSDRTAAQPGVFVLGHLPGQEVERIVTFAINAGHEWFATLAPANDYGYAVVRELNRVTEATGTLSRSVAFYSPKIKAATDAADTVSRLTLYAQRQRQLEQQREALRRLGDELSLKALERLANLDSLGDVPFDAILLPDGGTRLTNVAPLLPYYDVDLSRVRLLGTAVWETAPLAGEPAMVGGWFAATPKSFRQGFETRFTATFGRSPPRVATLAYDAVALAGLLVTRAAGRSLDPDILVSPDGFRGVDGLFRLHPDGTNERGLAVHEVTRVGIVIIDPAPTSFAAF